MYRILATTFIGILIIFSIYQARKSKAINLKSSNRVKSSKVHQKIDQAKLKNKNTKVDKIKKLKTQNHKISSELISNEIKDYAQCFQTNECKTDSEDNDFSDPSDTGTHRKLVDLLKAQRQLSLKGFGNQDLAKSLEYFLKLDNEEIRMEVLGIFHLHPKKFEQSFINHLNEDKELYLKSGDFDKIYNIKGLVNDNNIDDFTNLVESFIDDKSIPASSYIDQLLDLNLSENTYIKLVNNLCKRNLEIYSKIKISSYIKNHNIGKDQHECTI